MGLLVSHSRFLLGSGLVCDGAGYCKSEAAALKEPCPTIMIKACIFMR